jgi:hypothetical protein
LRTFENAVKSKKLVVGGRDEKQKRKECRWKKRMRVKKKEVNWTFRESGLEPIRK